eukprot:g3574.t1
MAAEEDGVARQDALGGGSRVDCLEPSFLSASPEEGADVWGGPLEPSALGGAPILVLCLLGLVSVAWTAFGAASFRRERDANNAAKGNKAGWSSNGDRTQRPTGEDVRVAAPPSTVGGEWATCLPEVVAAAAVAAAAAAAAGEQAVPPPPPSARSENGSTRDDVDDAVCFSDVSSYTMRSSELAPPSEAADRVEPGVAGGGSGGGGGTAGGVGMFFNGNEWRRGGRGGGGGREETDGLLRRGEVGHGGVYTGVGEGADGSDRETGRRRRFFDGVQGGAVVGAKVPGAGDGEEEQEEGGEGEKDRCCDSSRASSSVADLRSLEVAHWEGGPATPLPPWPAEPEPLSKKEHGLDEQSSTPAAAAAAATVEANAVAIQSVLGPEARHASAPVAPASATSATFGGESESQTTVVRDEVGIPADDRQDERTSAGGHEEEDRGEEERRLLTTIEALVAQLERDLDAARVLLPECHRFRKVVGCVSQAVGPGMDAGPRQAMGVTEALREATEYTRTLSSPEAFLVVMAELLADGFEDPTAMLGYCTRRLSRAVSALPEPSTPSSSARSSAAAARSHLRSLAKGPNGGGAAAGIAAGANGATRSSSSAVAPAAAGAVVVRPSDPPTAPSSSSAATMAVTPVPASASAATALSNQAVDGKGGSRRGGASATNGEQRGQDGGGAESIGPRAGAGLVPPGAETTAATAAVGTATTESGTGASGGEISAADDAENGDAGGGGGGTANGSSSPTRAAEEEEEEEPDAGADLCDTNLRSRMGPAFTNEAAGLNELIRRRGGLSALSDARTVTVVLRAAAPRRQSAFHLQPPPQQRQARGFFQAEPEDGGYGGGVLVVLAARERGGRGRRGRGGGEQLHIRLDDVRGLFRVNEIPDDANGVCQKLARRVEARIEAMVPFAFPNPTPASERRRVRNASGLLFSIMGADVLSDRAAGVVGGNANGSGSNRGLAAQPVAVRRGASIGVGGNGGGGGGSSHRSGGGGGRRAGGPRHSPPNLEEQLYAGLGSLLEAAKELLPAARDGGAAVNAVGQTAVLTLKGASAINRAVSVADTSLFTIPRRSSMCQHTVCAPRLGRKTLDGGTRYEDGVLLVPDCRKLRQEIVRSTCMDPVGSIRPDYIAYAGAPIFVDGAPLGTFCIFSRRTLKDLGWNANHTVILRGLADAAATEMVRLCRIAELEDQQRLRHHRREQSSSPQLRPQPPAPRRTTRQPSRGSGGARNGTTSPRLAGGSSRSSSATRRYPAAAAAAAAAALPSSGTPAGAVTSARVMARSSSFSDGSRARSAVTPDDSPAAARGRRATGANADEHRCPSDTTPPQRDGVLFLNGLDGRGGRDSRRSMSEEGAAEGFRPPPVLARRSTEEIAGGQAAAVRAAAAMAAAASSESPRGGAKKRWQRALRKLRLRPRRKSLGGGSDEGDNGSSSSLDVSRRRTAGGYADSQQDNGQPCSGTWELAVAAGDSSGPSEVTSELAEAGACAAAADDSKDTAAVCLGGDGNDDVIVLEAELAEVVSDAADATVEPVESSAISSSSENTHTSLFVVEAGGALSLSKTTLSGAVGRGRRGRGSVLLRWTGHRGGRSLGIVVGGGGRRRHLRQKEGTNVTFSGLHLFQGCSSSTQGGGALFAQKSSDSMQDGAQVYFGSCTAAGDGGGVDDTRTRFRGCGACAVGGISGAKGGGVRSFESSFSVAAEGSVTFPNSSPVGDGGGFYGQAIPLQVAGGGELRFAGNRCCENSGDGLALDWLSADEDTACLDLADGSAAAFDGNGAAEYGDGAFAGRQGPRSAASSHSRGTPPRGWGAPNIDEAGVFLAGGIASFVGKLADR